MPSSKARYKSYLLRFWQEHEHGPWRARVASIGQETEVKHFADATGLLKLLHSNSEEHKEENMTPKYLPEPDP